MKEREENKERKLNFGWQEKVFFHTFEIVEWRQKASEPKRKRDVTAERMKTFERRRRKKR